MKKEGGGGAAAGKRRPKEKKDESKKTVSLSRLKKKIPTTTTGVLNITSVGRSPHEASWSPSGDEVWVAIRGENFVEVLNGRPPFEAVSKVKVPEGPGMVAFSPDGNLAFVCSSFTPETVVVDAATKEIVATIKQNSTFCPNLAVTPDGEQVKSF